MMPQALLDFHTHLLGRPDLDQALIDFAREWRMAFVISCLGAGGGRVLFGSDGPGRDILSQIGKVTAAGVSGGCCDRA